jgi:uncharacterized protein YndB with AHSA1/START domain
MGQIKRSVMIDSPVEEVFRLMTDTTRFGDWVFGFSELTEGPSTIDANTSFRWKMKGHGLTLKPRSKIVSFDAPQRYEEEIRIPGILRGTLTKTVTQQKRRTQLSWVLDYRVVGGPLGVAADWLVAHRVAERAVQRSLEKARHLLETKRQPARGGYRRQPAVR